MPITMRRSIKWVLPVVVLAVAGAAVAMAASASTRTSGTVATAKSSKYGTVLVAANGRTLYRFMGDKKGLATCTGACTSDWPPLVVKAGAKPTAGPGANAKLLGTLKASNGKAQVTYAGFPLYMFAADKKSGQAGGEGVEGKWFVVNAKGALVEHVMAGAPPKPTTTSPTTTAGAGSADAWG